MKLRDQYDWVVLGDHPAALLSAAMAARLGLSVLALPIGESSGLTLAPGDFFLDREPNFVLGLKPLASETSSTPGNGLIGQCIGKLGILKSEEDQFLLEGRSPQVLTPGLRLNVLDSPLNTLAELKRELGADSERILQKQGVEQAWTRAAERIASFWSQWPDRLTLETTSDSKSGKGPRAKALPMSLREYLPRVGKELKASGKSVQSWFDLATPIQHLKEDPAGTILHEALMGIWAGLSDSGHLPLSREVTQAEMLHLLCMAGTGGSFRGGMSRFREFLRRLGRKHGVHFPERGECIRIFAEGNRFVGVQSSYRGQMIGAVAGILGISPERLPETLIEKSEKRSARYGKLVRVAGWRFSIAVFVDEKAIPPGMTPRMVWQEADSPALTIEQANPSDYAVGRPGQVAIFLRTVLPYDPSTLNREHQRIVAARMLRKFVEIVPFSEYRITGIYPDFRPEPGLVTGGATSGSQLDEAYGFKTLEEIPHALLVYEGEGLGCVSGVEGLYVATDESYPGMGSIGPTVAAMEAVALLAHQAGLAGPLA